MGRWRHMVQTAAAAAATASVLSGCSSRHPYQVTLDRYLAAREAGHIDQASTCLAPDARVWFEQKTGPGRPKPLTGGWGAWDVAMNASNTYDDVVITGDTLAATFHEQNDFSRLIGFPGWRSRSTFWFDDQGRIREQLYVPLPQHPPQQACFHPALRWAREHRAEELAAIYPNDQFEPDAETARRWRALLIEWREAERLPIPGSVKR